MDIARLIVGRPSADIVYCEAATSVREAVAMLAERRIGALPVMDGGNCVGSVSDWSLSTKSLEDTKVLDMTVSQVMDPPFPIVDDQQAADTVAKLLSKSNPAVLVRTNGKLTGIVTRSDLLAYLMAR